MADTLLDKIKKYKDAQGQISETSEEELQGLAQKAGLQAPPTLPTVASQIGVTNPHQMKMVGSPAQVQNAVQLSLSPNDTLQTAQRRQQVRQEATTQEKASQAKGQALQGLGDLGTRVNDLIDAKVGKIQQAQVTLQPVAGPAAADLAILISNPQDLSALARVNQALGRAPGTLLSPEELQGLYQGSTEAISAAASQAVGKAPVTVSDLVANPQFGYDVSTLSQLLGLPESQLGSMTVEQLQEAVRATTEAEFQRTADLESKATSGVLGVAERGLAREGAREASRTGQRASEADIAKLQEAVSRGDQVEFAGKTYSVGDLLKDEVVSKVVTDYLTAQPGSDTQLQLEQTEPQLVKWIKDNQASLADAAGALAESAAALDKIQKDNQAIAQVGNVSIDPELMKVLVPGYGELSATQLDTSKSEFLNYIKGLPEGQAEAVVVNANSLPPEMRSELTTLSRDEIAALELDKGIQSPTIQALGEAIAFRKQLDSISPDDIDSAVELFTGGEYSTVGEAQAALDNMTAASTLGLATYGTAGDLDRDGDGKVDSAESLLSLMWSNSKSGVISLAGAAKGQLPSPWSKTVPTYQPSNELSSRILDVLGDAARDGKLTPEEVEAAPFSEDEIADIVDSGLYRTWGEAGGVLRDKLQQYAQVRTEQVLGDIDVPEIDLESLGSKVESLDFGHGVVADIPSPERVTELQSTVGDIDRQIDELRNVLEVYGNKVDRRELERAIASLEARRDSYLEIARDWEKQREDLHKAAADRAREARSEYLSTASGDILPEPINQVLESVQKASKWAGNRAGVAKDIAAQAGKELRTGLKKLGVRK